MPKLTLFWLLLIAGTLQAQVRSTGMIYDEPSLRSIPYKAQLTADTYKGLPEKVSLEQFCPTVGDQGAFGTCVGFAVGYHLRTIMHNKLLSEVKGILPSALKTNETIFSPSYIYEPFKGKADKGCQDGMNPVDAFDLMETKGAALLADVPYKCGAQISERIKEKSKQYSIKGYQILFRPSDKDEALIVNSVKKSLSEGFPVMLGFSVAESFYDVKGAVWRKQKSDAGGVGKHGAHAMCIVGYDNKQYGGAFRVMNSWGTSWGDKGFVWIPYKDFSEYALIAIQAYGAKSPGLDPDQVIKSEAALKGNMKFQLNTGAPMRASLVKASELVVENQAKDAKEGLVAYKMDQSYYSGTRFRFYVTTNTEAYVYAFATDLSGKVNKILPFADNMSPHIGSNSTVAFPSEQKVIKLDDQPGTDYLLVLYTIKPLDAAAILHKMNQMQGGLTAKIKAALGDQLISAADIKYASNAIGFEVKGTTKGHIVPLMVEIGHN